MKNIVSTLLTAIFLVTASTLANAQNSSTNASPVTQNDLHHTQRILTKEVQEAETRRTAADAHTAQQLNDIATRQALAQQAIDEERQAEAEANAEHAVRDAKLRKQDLKLLSATAGVIIIMIIIGMLLIDEIRKDSTPRTMAPILAENADPQPMKANASTTLAIGATSKEIKAYVEAHSLLGQTIPYDYSLILDKASNKRVLRHGEILAAGTDDQEFVFGKHKTKSDKYRENAVRRDYEDSLGIHEVKRA